MLVFVKGLSAALFFASLPCAQGREFELLGTGQNMNLRTRQLLEKSCDGLSVDIRPPWEHMDTGLQGGATEESCRTCAASLESQGFLMSGWECYSNWFGQVHLKRCARIDVTPVAPRQTFVLDDVEGAGPIKPGKAPLPQSLRGAFWLTDQKVQSALITFGSNGGVDCQWCSHGNLILNRYLIRVDGHHTWAFATETSAGYDIVRGFSLLYDFEFNDAIAPTHAVIYPVLHKLGSFGTHLSKQTWLLTFDMTLLSADEAKKNGFPGSVVWVRKSYFLGIEVRFKRYYVVQVANEENARIEPAWSKFVAYQKSPAAGAEPGILYYHGGKNATARLYNAAEGRVDTLAGRAMTPEQVGSFFTLLMAVCAERASFLYATLAACMILAFFAVLVARRSRQSATELGYHQAAYHCEPDSNARLFLKGEVL